MGATKMSAMYVWQVKLAGKWADFEDIGLQDQVEAAYATGCDGYQFSARGWNYDIDLTRMVQVNQKTKRERPIRRQSVDQPMIPTLLTSPSKLSPAKVVPPPKSANSPGLSIPPLKAAS